LVVSHVEIRVQLDGFANRGTETVKLALYQALLRDVEQGVCALASEVQQPNPGVNLFDHLDVLPRQVQLAYEELSDLTLIADLIGEVETVGLSLVFRDARRGVIVD